MATIRKNKRPAIEEIKQNIEQAYNYFLPNYRRYHEFKKFVYKTTLTNDDLSVLESLEKPQIEFNVMEAYISRLRGEFSRMEPGFVVRAQDGVQLVDPRLIEVLEGHLKAIINDADNESFSYDIYTDLLVGGFSVAEVYTDYISDMSFDQRIFIERVFDPTLCGFDPLARMSHKGDGQFAFQMFPKTREEAVAMYGSDAVKNLKYARKFGNFSWSYRSQQQEIVLICDYYKKEYKKKKIIKLTNGRVVTAEDYEKFLEIWNREGFIEQPPQPVGKTRMSTMEEIHRYRISGANILEAVPTNYKMLPLVFFDGNSAVLRDNNDSTAEQMTRPYIYHVKDAQRLKNYAGQSLANELENTVEHKWIASLESIPEDYLEAYINVQKPSTLIYNQFLDGDPNVPLTPPREVVRPPIPAQISETFVMSDSLIQAILGSYDAQLGIQNNELSGVAIMQGAMHSNAAAMPYTVGFMKGLNRVAQIILDLIPKYYVTPRSIPVVMPDGKRDYQIINRQGQGNIFMNYDARNLEVKVQPGVNFAVQKQISLETIIKLMQSSEIFNQFMNQRGLEVLLDNIDIRGIDGLKQSAQQFMQQIEQQQQQAQQMQMQQMQNQLSPQQIAQMQFELEQAKIQQEREKVQTEAQVDLTKIATENSVQTKKIDIDFLEVMSKIHNQGAEMALQQERVDAEQARTAVNLALDVAKHRQEVSNNKDNPDAS